MSSRRGWIVRSLFAFILLPVAGWSALALWLDGPANRVLATLLVAIFVAACLASLVRARTALRATSGIVLAVTVVIAWWLTIPARNDRDWVRDVAELPRATVVGRRLTLHNVRNFDYRSETDFTERWETRTYDLDDLRGLDMFLSYWGPTLIAHTITSWDFGEGRHLAVSIETRKEQGETYSALRGFFRQFELYYVVADERDVIGVRAAHRGEHVFLYRLAMPRDRARALLLDYVLTVNRLADTPQWYNALTHNCTTTIFDHIAQVAPRNPFSWKVLANGYLDELGYEQGSINTSLPFAELRRRSDVTEKAKTAYSANEFSHRIRENLPPRPTRRTQP